MESWTSDDPGLDDGPIWNDKKNWFFDLVKKMGSHDPKKRGTAIEAFISTQLLSYQFHNQI